MGKDDKKKIHVELFRTIRYWQCCRLVSKRIALLDLRFVDILMKALNCQMLRNLEMTSAY